MGKYCGNEWLEKVGTLQLRSRHSSMALPSPSVTALLKGEQLRQEEVCHPL